MSYPGVRMLLNRFAWVRGPMLFCAAPACLRSLALQQDIDSPLLASALSFPGPDGVKDGAGPAILSNSADQPLISGARVADQEQHNNHSNKGNDSGNHDNRIKGMHGCRLLRVREIAD